MAIFVMSTSMITSAVRELLCYASEIWLQELLAMPIADDVILAW